MNYGGIFISVCGRNSPWKSELVHGSIQCHGLCNLNIVHHNNCWISKCKGRISYKVISVVSLIFIIFQNFENTFYNILQFYVATWAADLNGCIPSDIDVYHMVLHDKLYDNQKFDLDIQVCQHQFILTSKKIFQVFKTKSI